MFYLILCRVKESVDKNSTANRLPQLNEDDILSDNVSLDLSSSGHTHVPLGKIERERLFLDLSVLAFKLTSGPMGESL